MHWFSLIKNKKNLFFHRALILKRRQVRPNDFASGAKIAKKHII